MAVRIDGSAPIGALPVPFPDVTFSRFVLANGLTLIVHEDRNAPLIATQLRFNVGSRDEPPGRHGFAHLFEHLMFKGSAHRPGDWHEAIAALGGFNVNGTTNLDRTNYFQTVPASAIDRLLWMEADRMGHLLGGLTAESLAAELEVVKNEKRQRESAPMAGLIEIMARNLYPADHPYAHTTLGSFEDLDNATLDTARAWFSTWYGAANAVLVLAGDITPEDALAKVEHWFASIPSGAVPARYTEWMPPGIGARRIVMPDQVSRRRWFRVWNTPGHGSTDASYLGLLGGALTGTTSTPLRRRLIEQERLCHDVSVSMDALDLAGRFSISATLADGADVKLIEAIVEQELERLMTSGPSVDELDYQIRKGRLSFSSTLESLPAKAGLLASSECMLGAPDAYRKLDQICMEATPEQVAAAARRWLECETLTVDIIPRPVASPVAAEPGRRTQPILRPVKMPTFPKIEQANLDNGVGVQLIHRPGTGSISILLLLQGGSGNDAVGQEGLTGVTLSEMANGTRRNEKHAYRAKQRLLNAKVHTHTGLEYVNVTTTAQSNAFAQVADMVAEYALEPAYPQAEFDRHKSTALTALRAHRETAGSAMARFAPQLTYGVDHLYARRMSSTIESFEALTLADLQERHATLFRPAEATIFVVGDITLAAAIDGLQNALASWQSPGGHLPMRDGPFAPRGGRYLVADPGAPQSTLVASVALPEFSRANYQNGCALAILNYVLGGSHGSRLNRSLRVERGWTYGIHTGFSRANDLATFSLRTSVQADKTIDALREIEQQLTALRSVAPITYKELKAARRGLLLPLPGQWTSNGAVMSALVHKFIHQLPEDHYDTVAVRLLKTNLDEVAAMARALADVERMNFLIGGDPAQFDAADLTVLSRDAMRL